MYNLLSAEIMKYSIKQQILLKSIMAKRVTKTWLNQTAKGEEDPSKLPAQAPPAPHTQKEANDAKTKKKTPEPKRETRLNDDEAFLANIKESNARAAEEATMKKSNLL